MAALTIFIGSFLLFLVQPLAGGMLLPAFGASASVWITCLCTFQTLLVAGYLYSHALTFRLEQRRHAAHCALLLAVPAWIVAAALFRSKLLATLPSASHPALGTFLAVALLVGLPYVLLASNSSLVQSIARDGGNGRNVFRLYAVGNAGSFCGLAAYPFLVEPFFSLTGQMFLLAAGCALYAVFVCMLVWTCRKAKSKSLSSRQWNSAGAQSRREGDSDGGIVRWILFSAFSCFLLNSVTAYLTQDIAPIPMMWAATLGVYLLSWVVGFGASWRWLPVAAGVAAMVASAVCIAFLGPQDGRVFMRNTAGGMVLLFSGGCLIHSLLYRSRPEDRRLTAYYLAIVSGGAVGGVVASVVVPALSCRIVEYPVAVSMVWAIAVATLARRRGLGLAGVAVCVAFAAWAWFRGGAGRGNILAESRNFHSVSAVRQDVLRNGDGDACEVVELFSNGTMHGMQMQIDGRASTAPTTYYTDIGGGLCLEQHPLRVKGLPMRVAFCGMGVGTMAVYGRQGDVFRFMEINPDVIRYACDTNFFTFVSSSSAKIEIVEGDARKVLEAEKKRTEKTYDLIVVDVFTGDAIPVHMATREAVKLYLDRLAPDGILAFHISNWHLNLTPMVKAMAKEFGLHFVCVEGLRPAGSPHKWTSTWAYMSRNPMSFHLGMHQRFVDCSTAKDLSIMTDEQHSLLPYIIW